MTNHSARSARNGSQAPRFHNHARQNPSHETQVFAHTNFRQMVLIAELSCEAADDGLPNELMSDPKRIVKHGRMAPAACGRTKSSQIGHAHGSDMVNLSS